MARETGWSIASTGAHVCRKHGTPSALTRTRGTGKSAGILFEDDATGRFTHNIVCANQNEGVAVHGRAHPTLECNVVMQVPTSPTLLLPMPRFQKSSYNRDYTNF